MVGCGQFTCILFLCPIIVFLLYSTIQLPVYNPSLTQDYGGQYQYMSHNPFTQLYEQYRQLYESHYPLPSQSNMCALDQAYSVACSGNQMTYTQLVVNHNYDDLRSVIDSPIVQNNHFMQKCRAFHSLPHRDRLDRIFNHPDTVRMFASINAITHPEEIPSLIGKVLHRHGVRYPFHLNEMVKGSYRLKSKYYGSYNDQSDTLRTTLEYIFASPSEYQRIVESNRLIANFMSFSNEEWKAIKLDTNPLSLGLHFNVKEWVGDLKISEIEIDLKTLLRFQTALTTFNIDIWKDYLKFVTVYSLLHQTRSLVPFTEDVCNYQFKSYFPLEICRLFRSRLKHTEEFDHFFTNALHYATGQVVNANIFSLPSNVLQKLKTDLDNLKLFVNTCSLSTFNVSITTLEKDILYVHDYASYVDLIFHIISTPEFQMKRNENFDTYYRNATVYLVDWSPWFDPDVNSIFIPAGTLNVPSDMLRFNSIQYHMALTPVIFHEIFHRIDATVSGFPVRGNKWDYFKDWVENTYPRNSGTLGENAADVYGVRTSFESWDHPGRTDDERRMFIMSYLRLWCVATQLQKDDPHGFPYYRATVPLEAMWPIYSRLFNCTEKKVIPF